jgi:hypothetical protein
MREHGHQTGSEVAHIALPLLRGGEIPPVRDDDVEGVAEGFRRAGLTGLALQKLEGRKVEGSGGPEGLIRRLEEERNRDRANLTLLYHRLGRFADLMSEAGVRFIALKGSALAPLLYESPELRPMVDVDILIRIQDWPRARAAMVKAGYRLPLEKDERYWLANYFNMPVGTPDEKPSSLDLHWSLGQEVRYRIDDAGIWKRAVPYRIDGRRFLRLSDEDLLLNLILHMAYHYFDARLLWLYDIRLLCLRRPVDWSLAVARAAEWRMETVFALGLAYVEKAFPGSIPEEVLERTRPGFLHRLLMAPLLSGAPDKYFLGDDERPMQLVQGLVVMDSPVDAFRFMADKVGRRLRFFGRRPRLR